MTFKGRGGFTLLEVLVAFTIAALALVVLYRSSGESIGGVEVSGRYIQAASRAQSHLAALAAGSSLTTGESEGDDGNGFHWHLVVSPIAGGHAALNIQLYEITIEISWQEDARRRVFTLNTMRLGRVPPETLQ